jgi:hypothetical protein
MGTLERNLSRMCDKGPPPDDFNLMSIFICLTYLFLAYSTLHGLYLAFSASIIFGIIVIFMWPLPVVFSVVYYKYGINLPEVILKWLFS